MSTLLASIDKTKLKIRWRETYVSEGLDRALAALGRGVVFGFIPQATGGYNLRLAVDSEKACSLGIWYDSIDHLAVAYSETAAINYDLTAFAATTIYIGMTVDYTVGVETSGEIRAYTQLEYDADPDVLWLLSVDVPAGPGPLTDADINKFPRDKVWEDRTHSDDDPWEQVIFDPMPCFEDTWQYDAPTGNLLVALVTAAIHHEPMAWYFTQGGAAAGAVTLYPGARFRVGEGDAIQYEIWKKMVTVNVAQMTARIGVTFYDVTGAGLGTTYFNLHETGTVAWKQVKGGMRAPATAVCGVVFIEAATTGATTSEIFLQDFKVYVENQRAAELGAKDAAPALTTQLQLFAKNFSRAAVLRFVSATFMEFLPTVVGPYILRFGSAAVMMALQAFTYAYVANRTRVRRYMMNEVFDPALLVWAPQNGPTVQVVIAGENWLAMQVGVGNVVGFLIHLHKNEVIHTIVLGVETTLGAAVWDFDAVKLNLTTGAAPIVSSPMGVAAAGPGAISRCSFNISGDAVTGTGDGGSEIVLRIAQVAVPPASGNIVYIEVYTTYSTVEMAVNDNA